ncbi:TonB-dependent receptor plug domain-containing protein [Mangrovivirga sp. M17]|uniref:TonB-dependent receptor plug domain-containing protein n=1 Tax=Mangrovivirga halotolerans TaxID=2993936 RepID=A0ABT3RVW2_9BACT|nr:TonB-dependent receptor plug domain-containing protein [Mangrovivirga halotolerans]MCX2745483.1 TonB-dependent receptor plug domain-containing protein [Mangrovivirga halotolerans]
MRIINTVFFLLLFSNSLFCQKQFNIPDNPKVHNFIEQLPRLLKTHGLEDLRPSEDSLNIRIWQWNSVLTLNVEEETTAEYEVFTTGSEPEMKDTIFNSATSRRLLNSVLQNEVMTVRDDPYKAIDGSMVYLEISTPESYKIVSMWSPASKINQNREKVVKILRDINNEIDTEKIIKDFKVSLEPGTYSWGMTSFSIDKFMSDNQEKTDFYKKAQTKIRKELNINDQTDPADFPLIVINGIPRPSVTDLNQYTESEIESIKILKKDDGSTSLYGTRAKNGVVLVTTVN